MKTKKISLHIFSIFALVLCFGLVLSGCGNNNITTKTDENVLYGANYTSWYEYESVQYLDTSAYINFDNLDIANISKITFELYDDETLVGNAISEGENLKTLLKDCAQYWDKTEDTYLEVEGNRALSCAFKHRDAEEDNGYWVRSACSLEENQLPSHIVVKVLAGNTEYVTSSAE